MGTIGMVVAPFDVWYGLAGEAVCFIVNNYKTVRVYFVTLQVGLSLLIIIFLYLGVAAYAWFATRNAEVDKTEKSKKENNYSAFLFTL